MAGKSRDRDPDRSALIAPCGMNCGLCHAFLRNRNKCPGCRNDDSGKPKTRVACKIKNCIARRQRKFCVDCARFPCELLGRMDKRYRLNYGMSVIENLKSIKALGLQRFLEREKSKWACAGCGTAMCVHKEFCLACGRKRR